MMFDTSTYFAPPAMTASPFGPQGLFGYPQGQLGIFHGPQSYVPGQLGFLGVPGYAQAQFGQVPWQTLGHSPFASFAPSPYVQALYGLGALGLPIAPGLSGWLGQSPLAAQQLGISPFAQLPFAQLGIGGLGQPGHGPIGRTLPIEAALAMAASGCAAPQLAGWLGQSHLAATLGRGITPFQGVPQPVYTG